MSHLQTSALEWWLGSFGDGVEVLKPLALRQYFALQAKKMLARYQ
ncbi:MAG: WYL domain-containing protein [Ghiorsea sp.]|nr:WYL domain-containing protein [Ghiorsea sp.]